MKPGPTSQPELPAILAFGAHPDDIEFGCGGVIARETCAGRAAHFVVCSRGEAATRGAPEQRVHEAQNAAAILGATVEFIELDGDAHLALHVGHAIQLASIIRARKPGIVLSPSPVENQHPDHSRLARLVRDACRLARYGGVAELSAVPAHSIDQLLFYAETSGTEPKDITPLLIDISEAPILEIWKNAMEAHASQMATRNYVELQLARARARGLEAGVGHAIALFPNDPIVVDSLSQVSKSARSF